MRSSRTYGYRAFPWYRLIQTLMAAEYHNLGHGQTILRPCQSRLPDEGKSNRLLAALHQDTHWKNTCPDKRPSTTSGLVRQVVIFAQDRRGPIGHWPLGGVWRRYCAPHPYNSSYGMSVMKQHSLDVTCMCLGRACKIRYMGQAPETAACLTVDATWVQWYVHGIARPCARDAGCACTRTIQAGIAQW